MQDGVGSGVGKIPDYDHLFEEKPNDKKRKKKNVFGVLLKSNARPLFVSTLIYFLQASPMWLMPLITANIINIVWKDLI